MVILDKKEILVLFAVLILFISSVVLVGQNRLAGAIEVSTRDSMVRYLEEMATLENQHVAEIPMVFRTLFGNARVNGTIILNSQEVIYVGAITEDAKVKQVLRGNYKGSVTMPTVNVLITEKTIKRIAESKDPASEALSALENKEITYSQIKQPPQPKKSVWGWVRALV